MRQDYKGRIGLCEPFMNTRRACPALWLASAAVALIASGRSALLPASRQEVVSDRTRYEDKPKSLSAVEVQGATHEDVYRAGLQPRRNPLGASQGLGDLMLHTAR